ncbi:MAG: Mobile element protein, partial [uncultured Rubrobacteraceae bacterium]
WTPSSRSSDRRAGRGARASVRRSCTRTRATTSPAAARRSEGAASRGASHGAASTPARSSVVIVGSWSARWPGLRGTEGSRCATSGARTSTKPSSISAARSYASTTYR